jgi:hypothetical protein
VPEPGSPMELLFLLVWNMRQRIEFHKARSTLQAFLSQRGAEPKEIMSAFDDLREAFFPFDKNEKEDEKKRLRDELMKEVNRGPVVVEPMIDLHHSKIASKLTRGQERLEQRTYYDGTPIDEFRQAQRRPRRR